AGRWVASAPSRWTVSVGKATTLPAASARAARATAGAPGVIAPSLASINWVAACAVIGVYSLRPFADTGYKTGLQAGGSAVWERTSFGTRGAQVQILPLRPTLSSHANPLRQRIRQRIAGRRKNAPE